MRAPALAIAWEIWGANRRGWLLLLAAIPCCAMLFGAGADSLRRSEGLLSLSFVPMVLSLILVMAFCNFTDRDRGKTFAGFPQRLFTLPEVSGVFLGGDFITVTKAGDSDWFQLKPAVLAAIMEHFTAGLPVVTGAAEADTSGDSEDDDVVSAIKELLETRVRPAVAQDGGDIIFEEFTDGIVYLHMQGSCSGCPSSTATLKSGIENMLRHYIPEVLEVRAV